MSSNCIRYSRRRCSSPGSGYVSNAIDFAPAFCGSWCHSSSVRNGMKGCSKRRKQIPPSYHGPFAIGILKLGLDPFDIPIAEVPPKKLVDIMRSFMKTVILKCALDATGRYGQTVEQPPVHQWHFAPILVRRLRTHLWRCQLFQCRTGLLKLVQVHEQKPRRIPDLIHKVPRALNAVLSPDHVAYRGSNRQRKTHGIRPVSSVDFDRIDSGAFGLRHLLAVRRANY